MPDDLKDKIAALVHKFDIDKSHYLSKKYLEAEVRQDFLDPLFEALGWDIGNKKGLSPYDREVVVEKGDTSGRPDYNFRMHGATKFFVEAKAPSVTLDNINHIFQVKTYAWNNTGVYFVILTDFEGLKLYDASLKPDSKHPNDGLIFDFHYTEYINNIDKLRHLTRAEVEAGSLEKLVRRDAKSSRLRIPVDKVFLDDMTSWRETLAKDIHKRNAELDVALLNESVQKLLDRIIFIRIAEDRKIRKPRELAECVEQWKAEGRRKSLLKDHLRELFAEVNDDLNGDIFKPHHCESIDVDSSILADIIEDLYFPKCRYRFEVLGVELLGSIYERYLGNTIRVTPKRVVVEEKPEVRKAGGVYYTPKYIVDYIVKNTVGRLIEGKTPKEIEKIKIIDPACGSGSFLLGAYQCLLDYHTEYYRTHPKEAVKLKSLPLLYYRQIPEDFSLPIQEKARILKNNVFGVDIDAQAVEISMMSLYLKCLEGERGLLPEKQSLLPPLNRNIKCGNSLIGYDVLEQGALFGDDTKKRINPFDWNSKASGFGEIMEAGGFDAVIGNPPYGAWFETTESKYFTKKFTVFSGVKDVYALFIEKGISLLKDNSPLSFIVPSAWTGGPKYLPLRKIVLKKQINEIVMLPFDVFENAYIDTLIFVLQNSQPKSEHNARTFMFLKKEKLDAIDIVANDYLKTKQESWIKSEDQKIILDPFTIKILEKIRKNTNVYFSDFIRIKRGVLFEKKLLMPNRVSKNHFKYFEGNVYRYEVNEAYNGWIEFGPLLKERPKEFDWFEGERILLRRLVNRQQRLMAAFTKETFITNKNLYIIKTTQQGNSLNFVLGLLNSKIISYLYLHIISQATKDDFPQVTITDILKLPCPDMHKHIREIESVVALVDRMLDLNKKKAALPQSNERDSVEAEIAITDEKIDDIVYKLYGITDEERRIIEGKA